MTVKVVHAGAYPDTVACFCGHALHKSVEHGIMDAGANVRLSLSGKHDRLPRFFSGARLCFIVN
jgi:hypothetical protein